MTQASPSETKQAPEKNDFLDSFPPNQRKFLEELGVDSKELLASPVLEMFEDFKQKDSLEKTESELVKKYDASAAILKSVDGKEYSEDTISKTKEAENILQNLDIPEDEKKRVDSRN